MRTRKKQKVAPATTRQVSRKSVKPFNFNGLPKDIREYTSQFFSADDYRNGIQVSKEFYRLFHGREFWIGRFRKHFPRYNLNKLLRVKNLDWAVAFRIAENETYPDCDARTKRIIYNVNEGRVDFISGKIRFLGEMTPGGCSLCAHAARGHHQAMLDHFYQIAFNHFKNEEVNEIDQQGRTLLHWAIDCLRPVQHIQAMIDEGYDINQRIDTDEEEPDHPLLIAVKQGYTDCVALLIGKGTDIEWGSDEGNQIFLCAAARGDVECMRILLKMKIPINYFQAASQNALMVAAQFGHTDVVKLLLLHGADVNMVNEAGNAAHHYAALNDKAACLHLLLEHGAGLEMTTSGEGYTALLYAAREGSLECLRLLLNYGANVHATLESERISALMLAAENNYPKCIALLLQYGAKPNQVCKDGSNAVMFTAEPGHIECMRLLLEAGAFPNKVSKPVGYSALVEAARYGHADCVELLLAHRAKVNLRINGGSTALVHAAEFGHVACMRLLLAAGASPHITYGLELCTAITIACSKNHPECVQLLIDHDADVNTVTKFSNETPLFSAVKQGNTMCASLLLLAGANPDHMSAKGLPALYYAIINGNFDCAKLLVEKGADIHQVFFMSGTKIRELYDYCQVRSDYLAEQFIAEQFDTARIKINPVTLAKILECTSFVDLFLAHQAEVRCTNKTYAVLRF